MWIINFISIYVQNFSCVSHFGSVCHLNMRKQFTCKTLHMLIIFPHFNIIFHMLVLDHNIFKCYDQMWNIHWKSFYVQKLFLCFTFYYSTSFQQVKWLVGSDFNKSLNIHKHIFHMWENFSNEILPCFSQNIMWNL